MQKITPFLWYENQAEEAANFYTSVFSNSKILNIARYAEGTPGQAGTVMTVNFLLDGQEFMVINRGPHYKINEAISFVVKCETQKEIDEMWNKLAAGGEEVECGWLKDKFGVSWQIVPSLLGELVSSPEPEKSQRVMLALLKMKKLDIETLKRVYEG